MQGPTTCLISPDAPIGHTLKPLRANLRLFTAAKPHTPWVLHHHNDRPMQLLHIFLIRPLQSCMGGSQRHSTWLNAFPAVRALHTGSNLRIRPRHPFGQLILPSEVNPRVLARQEQLHAHIEDANHLQGGDGGTTAEVLEVVDLLGVVDR